ncbi:MAG: hypothetical protein WDO15_11245 [Bacteroidota bacterium]
MPKDYRKVIVARLKENKGIEIHPNTVYNTLHGAENLEVAMEILALVEERRALKRKFSKASIAAFKK